jgi:transposase
MGNPAGVRRDFEALEKRRFQAIHLLDEGLNQSEVAWRVKVARQTVVRWVAHLIEQEFEIRYREGHVWKILVGLGWSPQRPTGRARERDEQAIRVWKRSTRSWNTTSPTRCCWFGTACRHITA